MAEGIINILVLGISGLLSIPSLKDAFATPQPEKITINIGIGSLNSSAPLPSGITTTGGNTPSVQLYDVNGNLIGKNSDGGITKDDGSAELTISGAAGGSASETPEYIQLQAVEFDLGTTDAGGEVCVSWFSTTSAASDGADFRTWNAATAKFCRVPWYLSTAQFPGLAETYQPPCFWMSADGRFVEAMSARLTDFFFPGGSGPANSTATQWEEYPETLCNAPARQNFYNKAGDCIPFYPSGLSVVNQKDPETGFDVNFEAIESSYTTTCSKGAGVFYTAPPIPPSSSSTPPPPPPATADGVGNFGGVLGEIPATEAASEEASAEASAAASAAEQQPTSTAVGAKARARRSADRASILERRAGTENKWATPPTAAAAPNELPAITAAPSHPPQKQKQGAREASAPIKKRHEPVLDRRIERRAEEPHRWCQENQLVISEHVAHSAVELCESDTSWGPDFVAIVEGIFCDMCERLSYPLCDEDSLDQAFNESSYHLTAGSTYSINPSGLHAKATTTATTKATSTSQNQASGTGSTNGVCFDLTTNQLKAPGKYRRDARVPVKRYDGVQHW